MTRQCTHARKGIVSNQQWTNDIARPLMATATCDREPCIAAAVFEVQGTTGEKATFLSDAERWADPRWLETHPGWTPPSTRKPRRTR